MHIILHRDIGRHFVNIVCSPLVLSLWKPTDLPLVDHLLRPIMCAIMAKFPCHSLHKAFWPRQIVRYVHKLALRLRRDIILVYIETYICMYECVYVRVGLVRLICLLVGRRLRAFLAASGPPTKRGYNYSQRLVACNLNRPKCSVQYNLTWRALWSRSHVCGPENDYHH